MTVNPRSIRFGLLLAFCFFLSPFSQAVDGQPASSGVRFFELRVYPRKEARQTSWKEFEAERDWQKARADSEKDGKIVTRLDSTFMNPTDFSPMK